MLSRHYNLHKFLSFNHMLATTTGSSLLQILPNINLHNLHMSFSDEESDLNFSVKSLEEIRREKLQRAKEVLGKNI